eukprot:TRINITY_DN733_c0_g1_i16.p1 TRINITY_DN733_c0_g1~~TRINITY_DN733_c0_g1_i16.p1  ORF type:complete len:206 (+),score=38.96 TRINITY_DN733_c0_g1_i16:81-698(+)
MVLPPAPRMSAPPPPVALVRPAMTPTLLLHLPVTTLLLVVLVRLATCTCANGVVTTGGDPNPAANVLHDFTCTCDNMLHDFTCTCDSDMTIVKTDGPATCTKDECTTTPCGTGQTCNDPNTSPSSTGDYTCTCTNGVVTTGGSATCTNDECTATPAPCGAGQTCNDPNPAANVLHDFTCTCDNDMTIVKTCFMTSPVLVTVICLS